MNAVIDQSRLASHRSRRAAEELQDRFYKKLSKQAAPALEAVPDAVAEAAMPVMVEYGVQRSKKRLSVREEDFRVLVENTGRILRRPAHALKTVGAAEFKDALEIAAANGLAVLTEEMDRDVDAVVARYRQNRPAFYDEALFQGQDRLYFDLPKPPSAVAPKIEAAMAERGYRDMDYEAGLLTNKHGSRTKIGKALRKEKLDDLLKDFQEDPARADEAVVMISRDPEDIARMSADRDWSSCMIPGSHRFDRHLHHDLEEGTIVAYMVRPSDPLAHDAVARIALKPYHNEAGDTILVPNRTFGRVEARFPDFVRQVVDETVNLGKTGKFTMSRELLSDDLAYEVERLQDGAVLSEITLMDDAPGAGWRRIPADYKPGQRIRV